MDLNEIKQYFEANKDNAEVTAYLQGLNPLSGLSEASAHDFVEKNPVLKTYRDRFNDKAFDTWKKNNLDKLVEAKYNELHPAETPEQKKLREIEQKLTEAENKANKQALLNKALGIATEKKLPAKLVDRFLGDDEEATLANLSALETEFNTAVGQAVEIKLKENGREYTPPDTTKLPKVPAQTPREQLKRDLGL